MPNLLQTQLVGDPAAVVELSGSTVKKRSAKRRREEAQDAEEIDELYLHSAVELFITSGEGETGLLELPRPCVAVGCCCLLLFVAVVVAVSR